MIKRIQGEDEGEGGNVLTVLQDSTSTRGKGEGPVSEGVIGKTTV